MQSFGPGLLGTSGKQVVSEFPVLVDFTIHLGAHHRRQRKLLNPAFSVVHLRNMTPIFYGIARQVLWSLAARTAISISLAP
jgi:cytochrome P450